MPEFHRNTVRAKTRINVERSENMPRFNGTDFKKDFFILTTQLHDVKLWPEHRADKSSMVL